MIPVEMKNRLILELFFIVSCAIIGTVLIFFFIPEAPINLRDTVWHDAARIIWWGCGAITLFLSAQTRGNTIGAIMVFIFGPISLLTLVLYTIYFKIVVKNENT